MAQSCQNFGNKREVKQSRESAEKHREKERERIEGHINVEFGAIVESIMTPALRDLLGLEPMYYDAPDPAKSEKGVGLDRVYEDKHGNIVVADAKAGEQSLSKGLKKSKSDSAIRQMNRPWLERTARDMCTPGEERYSENNAEIGREILERLKTDPSSIRRIVFTGKFVNTNNDNADLELKVYEDFSDGYWTSLRDAEWTPIAEASGIDYVPETLE